MILALLVGCTTMDSFFFNAARVDAYDLEMEHVPPGQVEWVTFDTPDGETLWGVWARQEQGAAPAPTVVYFHGNKDHLGEYDAKIDTLWTLGFDVFSFDYRGYGRSTGTPTHDGVVVDGRAAIDLVEDTTGLPSTELAYVALSLGGYVGLRVAAEQPPRALVTEDMFARVDMLVDDGANLDLPAGWMVEGDWDNVAAAGNVHVPYLVIHGAEDTFIRPEHAQLVYAGANEPKELWLVEGADHADAPEVDPESYRVRVGCWARQDC